MCRERGVSERIASDPFQSRRRPECLSREILIPSNYDLLHQEVLRWMQSCVISRTLDSSGEAIRSEISLVQNSNLNTLWQSTLQHFQGRQIRICVDYIFHDRGLPNTRRLEFTTNSRPPVPPQQSIHPPSEEDRGQTIRLQRQTTEPLTLPEINELGLRDLVSQFRYKLPYTISRPDPPSPSDYARFNI